MDQRPTTATFSSVIAKLGRGRQNCETLKNEVGQFVLSPDTYIGTIDRDGESAEVLHRGVFLRPPPFAQWGAVFGDAIHCHRSALDQFAWHLTCVHENKTPPPEPISRSSPWRDVGFPIVLDRQHWDDRFRKALWGVDPALKTVFENAQPFVTHSSDPARAPLAVLERLWNVDKHRHIHFAELTVTPIEFTLRFADTGEEIPTETVEVLSHRWSGDAPDQSAPILRQLLLAELPPSREGEVEVDPVFSAEVSLPKGAPAFGGLAFHVLSEQNDGVRSTLRLFANYMEQTADSVAMNEWERIAREVGIAIPE